MRPKHNHPIQIFTLVFLFYIGNTTAQIQDSGTHEDWEYVLESTGDVLMVALPLTAGLTTIIKKDWQGTKQFAFSYATTFVVTHALKRIVRKERPEGREL